jgi:hypothetical protein
MKYETPKCKYMVFLDIDGVFTSTRVQYASANPKEIWSKFDPIAIEFMNKINDKYDGVYFSLVSTWKNYLDEKDSMISHWVLSSFRNAGFRGEFWTPWKTNPHNLNKFPNRAHEMVDYMKTYTPDLKDFIVFDDNNYGWDTVLGKKRWIKTDPANGLLFKHMNFAMSIMGTWDPKHG